MLLTHLTSIGSIYTQSAIVRQINVNRSNVSHELKKDGGKRETHWWRKAHEMMSERRE